MNIEGTEVEKKYSMSPFGGGVRGYQVSEMYREACEDHVLAGCKCIVVTCPVSRGAHPT